jgi:glucose dehydrogenase
LRQLAAGPSGDVRAFDALTGETIWRFHTVRTPESSERYLGERFPARRGGTNVWAPMSCDEDRGLCIFR